MDGNFSNDDDALNDGIVLGTAATRAPLVKDIANYGKRVWQYISGATANTKGDALLRATIKDAGVSAGGTLTVEVLYLLP